MKMESLQQRREELERKEYQLKESLLKFDKFLKVSSDYKLLCLGLPLIADSSSLCFWRDYPEQSFFLNKGVYLNNSHYSKLHPWGRHLLFVIMGICISCSHTFTWRRFACGDFVCVCNRELSVIAGLSAWREVTVSGPFISEMCHRRR